MIYGELTAVWFISLRKCYSERNIANIQTEPYFPILLSSFHFIICNNDYLTPPHILFGIFFFSVLYCVWLLCVCVNSIFVVLISICFARRKKVFSLSSLLWCYNFDSHHLWQSQCVTHYLYCHFHCRRTPPSFYLECVMFAIKRNKYRIDWTSMNTVSCMRLQIKWIEFILHLNKFVNDEKKKQRTQPIEDDVMFDKHNQYIPGILHTPPVSFPRIATNPYR